MLGKVPYLPLAIPLELLIAGGEGKYLGEPLINHSLVFLVKLPVLTNEPNFP